MRASIEDVSKVIRSGKAPTQITQKPFDFDPRHYRRLCDLQGAAPEVSDLLDYAYDMQYMELQPELLRYLTPILLTAWRKDLFEGVKSHYGGFVEQLWPALLKGGALRIFSAAERDAFISYMRNTILDRLDTEHSLHFSGTGASPYHWVEALVCYGTLFPDVELLWDEWWQIKTSGHAIAAFQYASALMYEDDKNPVFDAWTKDNGGGPPAVWDCGAMMFGGWKNENINFLKRTLTTTYFDQKLRLAVDRINESESKRIASGILSDFPSQRARLELRIEQLPELLKNVSQVEGFTI